MQSTGVDVKSPAVSTSFRAADPLRRVLTEAVHAQPHVPDIAIGPRLGTISLRTLIGISATAAYLIAYVAVIELGGTHPEALALFPVIVLTWLYGLEVGLLIAMAFPPRELVAKLCVAGRHVDRLGQRGWCDGHGFTRRGGWRDRVVAQPRHEGEGLKRLGADGRVAAAR